MIVNKSGSLKETWGGSRVTDLAGRRDGEGQAQGAPGEPRACGSRHPARLRTARGALSFLRVRGPLWGCKSDNRSLINPEASVYTSEKYTENTNAPKWVRSVAVS